MKQTHKIVIPNHFAANLSKLDLMISKSVPPGGNWKDLPSSIPSQRVKQIRINYHAGNGSRSTYYGRLRPDAPAYTINTYFSRPGNGCHIHYDFESGQHRTLSQREAARLQSFPDEFVFLGSKGDINKQIGNAVPPFLAYQIAMSLPFRGRFVDLFSGAGGLSLGFLWAGWKPVLANDIESVFLETYKKNIHDHTICGDIRNPNVFAEIVKMCKPARKRHSPLFVLGGPPCQGFSTAGNRRSMSDERNWLFKQYHALLDEVKPDGFLFENVAGLLSMEGGTVFQMIKSELQSETKQLFAWKLDSAEYGIPQRRTRIVLIGDARGVLNSSPPPKTSFFSKQPGSPEPLPRAISVQQALDDLPPLEPGEDGSHKPYRYPPSHPYQEFMRSKIGAPEYLGWLRSQVKDIPKSVSDIARQ